MEVDEETKPLNIISPWTYENLEDFLYYICPQCEEKCKTKNSFVNHALLTHPESEEKMKFELKTLETFLKEEENKNKILKENRYPKENSITTTNNHELSIKAEEDQGLNEGNGEDDQGEYFDDWNYENEDLLYTEDDSEMMPLKPKKSKKTKVPTKKPPKNNKKLVKIESKSNEELVLNQQIIPADEDELDTKEYQCYRCGEMIISVKSMKQHQKEKHNLSFSKAYGAPRQFQCHNCKATFETELRLQDHICKVFLKRKKKGEPIKCDICHKLFKRMCTLKHHLATVHVEEKPFQCDLCDYKAKAARFVFRHKQQVHDKILPHICHVCGKGFFTAFMMKNHTANVHNSDAKSFVCERCGKSFPSSVAFKAHMKSHQLFHMCTFCERIFTAKTKLRDHLAIDHRFDCSAYDDIFICPMCEKKHSSSNDLNDHLHFDHHLLKEHLCTQCDGKPFATKPMLTIHLMEAHEFNPIESVSYKAELADSLTNDTSAAQALSLKSMQVIEDNNLKGVRCDVCGRMLSCNRSLSDHKRQVHDKSNHIKCDLCNFTTFQPYMLKRHKQRNHDKSTKYDCEMCDFFTYDKGRLRVHKRGVHEKIKPHKCTECTSTYQTKYRLAVHMLREHNIVYKYK